MQSITKNAIFENIIKNNKTPGIRFRQRPICLRKWMSGVLC